MNYTVQGKVVINVSVSVATDDAESALEIAQNTFKTAYNLDVNGFHHDIDKDVEFELEVTEK